MPLKDKLYANGIFYAIGTENAPGQTGNRIKLFPGCCTSGANGWHSFRMRRSGKLIAKDCMGSERVARKELYDSGFVLPSALTERPTEFAGQGD